MSSILCLLRSGPFPYLSLTSYLYSKHLDEVMYLVIIIFLIVFTIKKATKKAFILFSVYNKTYGHNFGIAKSIFGKKYDDKI